MDAMTTQRQSHLAKKGMRCGWASVRFASAHDYTETFPSVRYKQIHKNTAWPAFTSTEIHKDQLAHYDSGPTSVDTGDSQTEATTC